MESPEGKSRMSAWPGKPKLLFLSGSHPWPPICTSQSQGSHLQRGGYLHSHSTKDCVTLTVGAESLTSHGIPKTLAPSLALLAPCHHIIFARRDMDDKVSSIATFFLLRLQALSLGDYLNHTHSAVIDDSRFYTILGDINFSVGYLLKKRLLINALLLGVTGGQ